MDAVVAPPPVVAVVVTYNAGSWLEELLASLAAQDYPDLSVLVIDAGSTEDPTARVAAALPGAYVRGLGENPGYAAAANHALDMVEGATFFLFCHDDVALEPDAIRLLVEEALRSNAGVVGPKLVDWDDPARLLQVGLSIDKTGMPEALVDRDELDQEQHDSVRDVFSIPGGCTLIRTDLFATLRGFDPVMAVHGEDVDLCWRAQVAGARVLIAPAARVRHLEALPRRRDDTDRRYLQTRHRLRTLLKSYGPFHLARVLPQAAVAAILEVLYALVAGRRRQAADVVAAWGWNAQRLRELRRARRPVQRSRLVRDSELRRLQVRGSARVRAFVRGQLRGEDRAQMLAAAGRDLVGSLRPGPRRRALVLWAGVVVILLVGSRHLLGGPLPAIGELAPFPGRATTFLRHQVSGWRFAGLGSQAPAPTAFGLLGVAGLVLVGAMDLLQKLLVLGALPVGAVGVWRVAGPLGSSAARRLAAVVYLAIPLPYNAIANGRWSGLLAYAAIPWLLSALARTTGLDPFGTATRSRRAVLGLGLSLALVGALVPSLAFVVLAAAVALVAGSLATGGVAQATRAFGAAVGGIVVAVVLLLPWALEFLLPGAEWSTFAGVAADPSRASGLGAVLRFETGPLGAAPLGWAFLVAGALPLIIGRGWRLAWAVRFWFIALAAWGLAWAGGRGWLPETTPPAEVMLVPAAVALALSAGLGLTAFSTDLRGYRFGWRQGVAVVAAGAAVLGALPVLGAAVDGRWDAPARDFADALAWMRQERTAGVFRVLWLGDPSVLPLRGWQLDEGVAYGLADDGPPTALDLWPPSSDGATRLVSDALRVAWREGTTDLGHLLAPMAVRYVVVAERAAPAREGTPRLPVPPTLVSALHAQLDLRRVESDAALVVYENAAWAPGRAQLPAAAVEASKGTGPDAALQAELVGAPPVLVPRSTPTRFTGQVAAGEVFLSQASSSGWRLRVSGRGAERRKAFGWANAFSVRAGGQATLAYETSFVRYALVVVQAGLWLFAIRTLVRLRLRARET